MYMRKYGICCMYIHAYMYCMCPFDVMYIVCDGAYIYMYNYMYVYL